MGKLRRFVLALLALAATSALAQSGAGVRTVYSSTNVGTTNWVVLLATLPNTVSQIAIADLSGQTMEIGICAAGASANSEVRQFLVPPGGVTVKIIIPQNQRISIRAVSSAATTGESDLNVLY